MMSKEELQQEIEYHLAVLSTHSHACAGGREEMIPPVFKQATKNLMEVFERFAETSTDA